MTSNDFTWRQMLKTKRFYLMFVMFLLPASVGLMIIGNITKIAALQAGITDTALLALLVSLIAFSNSLGRVLGGLFSDKAGRVNALFLAFALQAFNMAGFMFYKSLSTLLLGIIVTGLSYGALASIFPSLTADQFGLKNYGANYGVLFLSWGLAGLIAPVMADFLYDAGGSFNTAYIIAAIIMTLMIGVNTLLKADLASRG
jgi:MFS family permease